MTEIDHGKFIAPSDEEFLNILGLEPEQVAGESFVRQVRWIADCGDILTLTYDLPGRSVRVRWESGGKQLLDIFREGAVRLSVSSDRTDSRITINFEAGGVGGELVIRLAPEMNVDDRLLLK